MVVSESLEFMLLEISGCDSNYLPASWVSNAQAPAR